MKLSRNFLRDRTTNGLIVAVIIGYSVVTYVQMLVTTVGLSGPPADFWIRMTIGFVGSLLLAWVISWFAE